MIDALQTATAGMTRASDRLGTVAQAVASIGAPTGNAALPAAAQVDLSGTVADLIEARTSFALNAAVLRTADRMNGQLLDITA